MSLACRIFGHKWASKNMLGKPKTWDSSYLEPIEENKWRYVHRETTVPQFRLIQHCPRCGEVFYDSEARP